MNRLWRPSLALCGAVAVAGVLMFAMGASADEPQLAAPQVRITHAEPVWPQEVRPGKPAVFNVQVYNGSERTMPPVKLSWTAPAGWAAHLEVDNLEALRPGESRSTRLTVQAPWTLFDQQAEIAVKARSGSLLTQSATPILARPARALWPAIGASLALLIGAIFTFLFLRLNRRGRNSPDTGGPR